MDEKRDERRWRQFGLSSLLVAVTIAALAFGAIRAWDWGPPMPDWHLIRVGMSSMDVSEIIGKSSRFAFREGGLVTWTEEFFFASGEQLYVDYDRDRVTRVRYVAE